MDTRDKRLSERREFLKKAAYTAPAILSLQALSAVAKAGSEKGVEEAKEKKEKSKRKKAKKKSS